MLPWIMLSVMSPYKGISFLVKLELQTSTLLVFGAKVCRTQELLEEVIHDFPSIHPCLIYPLTLLQLLQFLSPVTFSEIID